MNWSIPFEKRTSVILASLIALLCFLIQSLIWDIGFMDFRLLHTEDSVSYLSVSEHLQPDKIRTIGYPWLIHITQRLNPEGNTLLLFVQFAFMLSIHTIVLYVLFGYVQKRVSLPLALLFLINPSLQLLSHAVLTECLFCFLITVSFYFFSRYYYTKHTSAILLSFLFICLATLVRPGLYYFCFGSLVYAGYYFIRGKKFVLALSVAVIFTASVGFQVFKFYEKFQLAKLSIIDDITMWQYDIAKMNSLQNHSETMDEMNLLIMKRDSIMVKQNVRDQSQFYKHEMKDRIKKEPSLFLQAYADNLLSNFHTGNLLYGNLKKGDSHSFFHFTRVFNMLNIGLLIITSLIVLVSLLRKRAHQAGLLVAPLLLCNYLFFTAGISYWQGDRFNAVWFPILYMCIGLLFKSNRIQEKSSMFV